MTIWLESIIAAYGLVKDGDVEGAVRAAYVEDFVQMEGSGEVQEKVRVMEHVRKMTQNGYRMYKFSHVGVEGRDKDKDKEGR